MNVKTRRRASAVVVHDNKLLTILMQDPHSGETFHTVPGGEIEEGEHPASTAQRETLEESGYHIHVDRGSEMISGYPFIWNGTTYACETWWYRGELASEFPDVVDDEAYILSARWHPLSDVETLFSFHPDILSSIQHMVRNV